jgi:hypothetical protein
MDSKLTEKQVPIGDVRAGLYSFAMRDGSSLLKGHIVVRGLKAGPIGAYDYPAGTETWYWGEPSSDTDAPSWTLELTLMRSPDDAELIDAVAAVRKTETEVGTAPMVPTWKSGAPLPAKPVVVTMTNVTGGPGSYGGLYTQVSFLMPIDQGPLMPTFYTAIPGLYSIFGGDPIKGAPVAEGMVASFTSTSPGKAGYPNASTWLWFGRDPS